MPISVPRPDPDAPAAALITATARRVLLTEADAVRKLADHLPADFIAAVLLILGSKGRVILSGIGKSGHVGRKIAATLSSTGTPAFFVHPAEASHGDMGTITPADICILLSNSGETTELGDLIAHTRRFAIPLIGISGRMDSTLMQAADLRLELVEAPEACIIGMAPTTSTTMTLALGDALAIALMEQRGFAPEHFQTFHPGGRLGARVARVAAIMRGGEALPLVVPETPMSETLLVMTRKGLGVAGVVQDGVLTGIITDGDLRRNMDRLMEKTAGQVATKTPLTVAPGSLAVEAVALMNQHKIQMLFVVTPDRVPLGVLHIQDCLRAGVA